MDWKRKLSSRKLWVSLVGFLALLLAALGMPDATVAKVVALVMAGAELLVYVITEAWLDAEAMQDKPSDS